ncbi:sda1 domain protein 1, partial [Ichthyophthirius multifiliis]
MAMMHLISRMIGRHQLIILSFYSFVQKYLQPHQKEITKILAYLAESVHKLVPPEELQSVVKHIIENFVNDRCSEQAMTWGLNTIREMCLKNYHIIDDFSLNYLAGYYNYKNKYVSKSAKSIINLFRQINPKLLDKKFRGRMKQDSRLNDDNDELLGYGQEYVHDKIEGADLIDDGGDVPIYMDRVMTDEDFRKIKFLQMKQAQEEDFKQQEIIEKMKLNGYYNDEDSWEEDENDEEQEDYKQNKKDKKQQKKNNDYNSEDYNEVSEISDDYQEDEEGDEIEDEEDELEEGDEDEDEFEDELEEGNADEAEVEEYKKQVQQIQIEGKIQKNEQNKQKSEDVSKKQKSKTLKLNNKKRKEDLAKFEGYSSFDSEEYEEEFENNRNIHGFINQDYINIFKKKKSEA